MYLKKQKAALTIDRANLNNILRFAEHCHLDISELSYTETQAVLVLWGLHQWLESYHIQPPFDFQLGKGKEGDGR